MELKANNKPVEFKLYNILENADRIKEYMRNRCKPYGFCCEACEVFNLIQSALKREREFLNMVKPLYPHLTNKHLAEILKAMYPQFKITYSKYFDQVRICHV